MRFRWQVDVPFLQHSQREVHGLLGQRAIKPASVDIAAAQKAHDAQREAERRRRYVEKQPAGVLGEAKFGLSRVADGLAGEKVHARPSTIT